MYKEMVTDFGRRLDEEVKYIIRWNSANRICILVEKVVLWSQPEVNRMVARVKEVGLNSIIKINNNNNNNNKSFMLMVPCIVIQCE